MNNINSLIDFMIEQEQEFTNAMTSEDLLMYTRMNAIRKITPFLWKWIEKKMGDNWIKQRQINKENEIQRKLDLDFYYAMIA